MKTYLFSLNSFALSRYHFSFLRSWVISLSGLVPILILYLNAFISHGGILYSVYSFHHVYHLHGIVFVVCGVIDLFIVFFFVFLMTLAITTTLAFIIVTGLHFFFNNRLNQSIV